MRYTLIRYASAKTKWAVHYALRRGGGGVSGTSLVLDSAGEVLTFRRWNDALAWVETHHAKSGSIEWEGNLF